MSSKSSIVEAQKIIQFLYDALQKVMGMCMIFIIPPFKFRKILDKGKLKKRISDLGLRDLGLQTTPQLLSLEHKKYQLSIS